MNGPFQAENKISQKIFLYILDFVLFFFLGFYLISSYAADKKLPKKLPDINAVTADTFSPTINMLNASSTIKVPEYAIIRANDETTFSSETVGTIIGLFVKSGSYFKKGDVLLQIDCRLQQADYKKAHAEQVAANKALQSARRLEKYGLISELEYIKAQSISDGADADAAKLAAIVERCRIVAPFTGGVVEVKAHLYETVKPGDALLKVTNIDNLFVEVQVPSHWLSWLHIQSPIEVHVNDINKTILARVTYINPEIDPISETVKIVGEINPPISNLRPGMTGQALFPDNPKKISSS